MPREKKETGELRKKKRNSIVFLILIGVLISLPFLVSLLRIINVDFWYDEIVTLNKFVFTSIKTTISDYHLPNNHIFHNLINNIYLKALGVKNLYALMDSPYKIRLLHFFYTMVTIFFVYLIGLKFFNREIAWFSLVLFVTSIPLYNFALQIRGYSLSIMLSAILIFFIFGYERRFTPCKLFGIGIIVTLLLYTIPSNFYLILAFGIIYLIKFLQKKKKEFLYMLVSMVAGTITAVIFYLPVWKDLTDNQFVKSQGLFNTEILFEVFPKVIAYFFSAKYLIIVLILIGLILNYKGIKHRKEKLKKLFEDSKVLLCVFVLPFIFSFVRGDRAFDRIFFNLLPIFSIVLGVLVYFSLLQKKLENKKLYIILGIVVYSYVVFAMQISNVNSMIKEDIVKGRRTQYLYYYYYLSDYKPRKLLQDFNTYRRPDVPVVLYGCDVEAMPVYFDKFGIKYYPFFRYVQKDRHLALKELFGRTDKAYIISVFPYRFQDSFKYYFPEYRYERMNKILQFHDVYLVEKDTLFRPGYFKDSKLPE